MGKTIHLPGGYSTRLQRDSHGVFHIQAASESEMYRAMGYSHACDRGMQVLMMRILGRGEASQWLEASEEMLAVDTFFRRMNWHGNLGRQVRELTPETRELCQAYCAGVNLYLSRHLPWELKLLGYVFTPWTLEDCLLLSRMTGYINLAQSQGEIERLLIQMVQNGVETHLLEELFPGQLQGLDTALLRQVPLPERLVPESVIWNHLVPRAMASNNWVVAGSKTASGQAMLANDPHLEGNRLPNVWYELALQIDGRFALGATMPGMPGILLGRTPELAWGATYTFMDAIDSWIEDCRDGNYRYEKQWKPFQRRQEIIRRKKGPPVTVTFYENNHGVLAGDPTEAGYYLTTRWASADTGARSLNQMLQLMRAKSVPEGMECLGRIETAWNWVLADRDGHIGYQMSGLCPIRREGISGLVPLPGWEARNDWQGFEAPERLPRAVDPPSGFLVTANQDLNHLGQAKPINMPMGPYRADRIQRCLAGKAALKVEDMQAIQLDTYSQQAALFMEILRPLLPDTPQGRLLRDWDCHYELDSTGAYLFEKAYQALLHEIFGDQGLGCEVCAYLLDETGIFADFYYNFDRILLAETSAWFQGRRRNDLYREILAEALHAPALPWSTHQQIVLKHLLVGEKLPQWAGFDRGPVAVRGGRATPHQGQIYRSGGRTTSFIPTFRLIADFAEKGLHTCLLGGPSDRRFSKWYASGVQDWQKGVYKKIEPL